MREGSRGSPQRLEQRRCDKSRSVHNKICTDDSASTQCTLDECEQKRKDHTDFTHHLRVRHRREGVLSLRDVRERAVRR